MMILINNNNHYNSDNHMFPVRGLGGYVDYTRENGRRAAQRLSMDIIGQVAFGCQMQAIARLGADEDDETDFFNLLDVGAAHPLVLHGNEVAHGRRGCTFSYYRIVSYRIIIVLLAHGLVSLSYGNVVAK
jgi:hypothetical protein